MSGSLLDSPGVVYGIAAALGVAVGLISTVGSRVANAATGLVTAAALAVGLSSIEAAPWGLLTFALAGTATPLFVRASDRARYPLISDEPYWRRVLLIATHSRLIERREEDDG